MDDCNYTNKSNCLKGYTCPQGYECCSESKNTVNAKATFGHCVKNHTCDFSRGICKGINNKISKETSENFDIYLTETFEDENTGSNENCSDLSSWKRAFWVVFILLGVLLIFFAVQNRNKYW